MRIRAAPEFLDVEKHPKIAFSGHFSERIGATAFKGEVELTIRGVSRTVPLDIHYFGEWETPFWVGDENRGELRRIAFDARARANRYDFGVSWQDEVPGGGVVVSNEIELVLDVEAIRLEDLERTGAMSATEAEDAALFADRSVPQRDRARRSPAIPTGQWRMRVAAPCLILAA
jgi:hypothetical protein